VTCGKFIAPLLQQLSPKFTESIIGETLSIQYGIVALLAGIGGSLADRAEKWFSKWGRGRLLVIAGSVMLGTLAFLGHALPSHLYDDETVQRSGTDTSSWDSVLAWHVLMRFIYAVSMAICAPALDGLALAHLDTMEGATQAEFGKERMYGAVFWGLGSLFNGIGIDRFGFDFLYFMVILSTVVSYLIIGVYIWGLERDTTGAFSRSVNKSEPKSTYLTSCVGDEQQINHEKIGEHVPTKDLFLMLCRTGYGIAFCVYLFILAMGISVVDNLAFIFFAFLGSSDTTNGFSVVFTVIMEIPCFHYAPELLKHYSPGRMLLIAGGAYVIRVLGYTLVPIGDMWMILILETLHGFTYACQKVGSVEYVARIMPKGYEASGQGILILISYLGVVIGLVAAGWMQEVLGARPMYGFMGLIVLVGMIILAVAEKCSPNDNVSGNNVPTADQNNERTNLLHKSS
jgi:MFS family permease